MPLAIDNAGAVMLSAVSVAAVTFNTKLLDVMGPCAAVTVEDPTALPVASPDELMLAVAPLDDAHVTDVVRSCVLLSLKIPVALN